MRSTLAANARGIQDLVALLPSEKDLTAAAKAPAGMGAGLAGLRVKAAPPRDKVHVKDPELVLNVLAALANVTADVTAAAVRVMLNAVAIVGGCEEKSKRPRDGRPTRRSKCLLRGRRRRHPKSIFGSAFWERRCFQLAFRIASV